MIVPSGSLRIFPQIRSLHVAELNDDAPRPMLFFGVYYEARGRPLPDDWEKVSMWGAIVALWRRPPATLELWEPIWPGRVTRWLMLAAIFRLRTRGHEASSGFFAIFNGDIRRSATGWGPLQPVKARIVNTILRWSVPRLVDRVVYGTPGSQESYATIASGVNARMIANLRAARQEAPPVKTALTAAFVGVIDQRKGIPQLMQAWEEVERDVPGACLTVIGEGRLGDRVAVWASASPSSRIYAGGVARERVLATLGATSVLVSPSQRDGVWREQVGLPNVEALSAGCTIVTTDETGLAAWLTDSGHRVVDATRTAADLPGAITDALLHPIAPSAVLGSLPDEDGRLRADHWLHGDDDALSS